MNPDPPRYRQLRAEVGDARIMARREIDHSLSLQIRLLELVNTDTCDVTFVVGPGPGNDHPSHTRITPLKLSPLVSSGDGSAKDTYTTRSSSTPTHAPRTVSESSFDGPSPGGRETRSLTTLSPAEASQQSSKGLSGRSRGISSLPRPQPSEGHSRRRRILELPWDNGRGSKESVSLEQVGSGGENTNSNTALDNTALEVRTTRRRKPSPDPGFEETTSGVREYRCHRVMFASCSEYFRVLLYGRMSESVNRRVELPDVAPEGFGAILTYAYTGRVVVTTGAWKGQVLPY